MKFDWSPLSNELSVWRAQRLTLPLWWRDDDAVAPTRSLDRLLKLSADLHVPIHLAVISRDATPALATLCAETTHAVPMVHGWAHENHAPQNEKKAEFGHVRANAVSDAATGLARIDALFGADFLPIFVPPWNRIHPAVTARLPEIGFTGLSAFGPRQARTPVPGLVQINTHIDPIDWRGSRSLTTPEDLIGGVVKRLQERRMGRADAAEPLGLLTHHLVHDPDIWEFTHASLSVLLDNGAVPVNLMKTRDDLP